MLTEQEKQRYLSGDLSECPKCESDNIETTSPVQTDYNYGWQPVQCLECGFKWRDIYNVVDIEEVK